jgi:hypothetical protein
MDAIVALKEHRMYLQSVESIACRQYIDCEQELKSLWLIERIQNAERCVPNLSMLAQYSLLPRFRSEIAIPMPENRSGSGPDLRHDLSSMYTYTQYLSLRRAATLSATEPVSAPQLHLHSRDAMDIDVVPAPLPTSNVASTADDHLRDDSSKFCCYIFFEQYLSPITNPLTTCFLFKTCSISRRRNPHRRVQSPATPPLTVVVEILVKMNV